MEIINLIELSKDENKKNYNRYYMRQKQIDKWWHCIAIITEKQNKCMQIILIKKCYRIKKL